MKKTVAALLSVILFLSFCLAAPVMAESVEDTHFVSGDYVCIKNGDGTVSLLRYQGKEDKIMIPDEIEGMKVTEILSNCFFMSPASSITIPNGVTKIGLAAFGDSNSLTSVAMPDSLTFISASAFYNCKSLKTIAFSKNLSYVGLSAFDNTAWYDSRPNGAVYIGKVFYGYKGDMPKNTKLTVKNGTVSISQQAFINCKNLTGITLPSSLKEIGSAAFSGCTGLKSIIIPNGVEKLESGVFYQCINLEQITLPDSIRQVGVQAFEDTKWFKTQKDTLVYVGRIAYRYNGTMPVNTIVKVRENTIGLGTGVFSGCENLAGVVLPNEIKEIPYGAFQECTGLKSIDLPVQITKIGECAFRGCVSLTEAVLPKTLISLGRESFYGCTSLENVSLPDRITSIESGTFSFCPALSKIEIPYAVQSIAERAFMGCSSLKTITFPKYLLEIGESAFEQCSALQQIKLPKDLHIIGANAFLGCKKLKDVFFPGNKTEIGDYAFGYYQAVNEYGDSYNEKIKDFFISGNNESTARQYAEENSIPYYFVSYLILRGDADGDGEITTADVLTIQKYLAKIIGIKEIQIDNGDTDYNGKIDTNDVLRIQMYLAKIIDVL